MAPSCVSLRPPWVTGQAGHAAKGRITRVGPGPARAALTSPSQAARCGPVCGQTEPAGFRFPALPGTRLSMHWRLWAPGTHLWAGFGEPPEAEA